MKKLLASLLIRPLLRFHNVIYSVISRLAVHAATCGCHPKHDIIAYQRWFYEKISPGAVVLDIGCNTGKLSARLSEKAKHVYGVDIDRSLVGEALRRNGRANVEFLCADATTIEKFPLNVDHVILSNVLEHIEERIEFLCRIVHNLRFTQNCGTILLRVPMLDRDWLTLYKKQMKVPYFLDETHFTEYTIRDLVEELSRANLRIVQSEIRFGEIYAVCRVAG